MSYDRDSFLKGFATALALCGQLHPLEEADFVPPVEILTAIRVDNPPTKTQYTAGEALDLSGLRVSAVYSNGRTEDITSSVTTVPGAGRSLFAGQDTVEVSWSGQTTQFSIAVEEISVEE